MVNIVAAMKLFSTYWVVSRILIKYDNDAFVKILTAGKEIDPFLEACARNIWYIAALGDMFNMFTYWETITQQLNSYQDGLVQTEIYHCSAL